MPNPTYADLILLCPWTLHRKMLEQQLQETGTIASSLPCICVTAASVRFVCGGRRITPHRADG